jgi:hypothetical protein
VCVCVCVCVLWMCQDQSPNIYIYICLCGVWCDFLGGRAIKGAIDLSNVYISRSRISDWLLPVVHRPKWAFRSARAAGGPARHRVLSTGRIDRGYRIRGDLGGGATREGLENLERLSIEKSSHYRGSRTCLFFCLYYYYRGSQGVDRIQWCKRHVCSVNLMRQVLIASIKRSSINQSI